MRGRINFTVILKPASLHDSVSPLCFWRLFGGIGLAGGLPVRRLTVTVPQYEEVHAKMTPYAGPLMFYMKEISTMDVSSPRSLSSPIPETC